MKSENKKLKTLLEKQNPWSNDKGMSQKGKAPEEMLPYLLSGEPDDLPLKKKK